MASVPLPERVKPAFSSYRRDQHRYNSLPGERSTDNDSYLCGMDYFKQLSDLLRTEEQADRLAYRQLTESSSLGAKRANGLSWYPIVIRDTEMGAGDYLTVEMERTNNFEVAHLFRFGASVELFSNRDPKEYRVEGVVTYQGGNKMKISLRTDELPDWSREASWV
ncbi:hypothetical protein LZZ85_21045 [Terrimonas sp. NA20]|uniref:PilZ domain-containing protein n=1 Tax=Terrimonas ginsenosidimutans TaxID=2908004 RepID=A0ABS9KWR2_9BACT|nr:hypothetical protein [Terrimonas ginsenosidimutans]MCG2616799.1 hypothetical protein [Terrimonas ginsenosidimutans]